MISLLSTIERSSTLRLVERQPDGVLAVHTGAQLISRCGEWSTYVERLGAPRGTAVVLPMRSSVDAIAVLLACWQQGLMPVLVRPAAPMAYVQTLLQRLGDAVVVLDAASLRLLDSLAPRIQDGSPSARFIACVVETPGGARRSRFPAGGDVGILSTGSTGEPKVIVNSIASVTHNAALHARAIGLDHEDIVGLSLPLSFSYGFVAGLLATLQAEATAVLLEPEQVDLGQALIDHRATVAMGTPFTARRLLALGALGRLRALTIGGDVLHTTVARELLESNPTAKLYATYGLSEAGPRVATCQVTPRLLAELGAIPLGAPLDGVTVRIADPDPESGTGELRIQTPTRMLGYLDDPAGTADVVDAATGELATGDQVVARDGELFFAGRTKRVICRAGEKVYPAMVERQILSFGNVRDVLVTAAPHAEYGEIAHAYVIPGVAFSLRELERQLRRTLPRSHVPHAWEIVEQFPAGARK